MELRQQLQETLGSAYTLERELSGGGMSRVFVALWKDADPELQPKVAEVKRRLARLGGIEGR